MKLLSAIGSFLSGLTGLFRGREPFELDKRELEKRPYINKQEAITHVHRGGRHSGTRSSIFCPCCWVSTSKRGLCLNRMCEAFNGREVVTHPDLLSLRRRVRLAAQKRWLRGGKAALWAT